MSTYERPSQHGAGFTLVELLVVIGIITILAAILFPVFQKVRGRATATACAGNLSQLRHAYTMYTDDNDQKPPPQGETNLVAALVPYLHSSAIWFCPSDPFARTASQDNGFSHLLTSYMLLQVLPGIGPGSSREPLFTDHIWPCKSQETPDDESRYSHDGRFNVVYFDGHLDTFRWDDPLHNFDRDGGCVF